MTEKFPIQKIRKEVLATKAGEREHHSSRLAVGAKRAFCVPGVDGPLKSYVASAATAASPLLGLR